jgi:hypothetical protein
MTNKERFKKNVRMVELEQHSYCNRKCWFCPNNFIDRRGPVKFLDAGVYIQILNDLASIDYDQIISFSGNCEPFSQPVFPQRVRAARELLPDAFLMTNTNTDYLTTRLVHKAALAGLNVIKAQLYFDKNEVFCNGSKVIKMNKLKEKLPGIEFVERHGQWFAVIGKMILHAYAKDWHKVGHNRCDVNVRKTQIRMHTCFEAVQYFGVSYEGIASPCCNIRTDYGPYRDILLGKMDANPGTMFRLYEGALLSETEYPCRTCMGKHGHPNGKLVYNEIMKELEKWQTQQQTL